MKVEGVGRYGVDLEGVGGGIGGEDDQNIGMTFSNNKNIILKTKSLREQLGQWAIINHGVGRLACRLQRKSGPEAYSLVLLRYVANISDMFTVVPHLYTGTSHFFHARK